MRDAVAQFSSLPGRLLLDTCVLNCLFDEGGYIWEGELDEGVSETDLDPDLRALRAIFTVNERASFQFVISPLTVAEIANTQDFPDRERRVRWVLDVLDHWLILLDDLGDRVKVGGTVRHRFKLPPEMQQFEADLMTVPDLRRDPFDRLLLVQYRMGNCDAFLTTDRDTIWCHREWLAARDVRVLCPAEFWEMLKPWAALWR
jgi:hypothetical protein